MQIFVNPNYDFLKWRWRMTALFLAIVAIGAVFFLQRGINLGIDFSGGASIILRFREQVPLNQLRTQLPNATIQQYGPAPENSILIRLPQQRREGDYAGETVLRLHSLFNGPNAGKHDLNFHGRDRLAGLLSQADPDRKGTQPSAQQYYEGIASNIIARRSELGIFANMQQAVSTPGVTTGVARVLNEQTVVGSFNLLSQETVGPQVGSELQRKALLAIILATLAMGVYIGVRFDLMFGVAAVLALVVDVAVTFAFLVIVRAEFSLVTVASFLMVIGYSINDKVVIYDRVRENMRKVHMREDFESVLNRSLNQTLSRTILTGGCVLLILLSLIFLGGAVIHDFAMLLFVGTVVGTITTLTVVPAIVVAWKRRWKPATVVAAQRAEARREETARKRKAS